jgi:hypothetical protein
MRYGWTSRRGNRGLVGKPSDFGAQSQVTIISRESLTRDGVDNSDTSEDCVRRLVRKDMGVEVSAAAIGTWFKRVDPLIGPVLVMHVAFASAGTPLRMPPDGGRFA